MNFELGAAF